MEVKKEFHALFTESNSDRMHYGVLRTSLDDSVSEQIELAYAVHLAQGAFETKETLWLHYEAPGTPTIDTFLSKLRNNDYPKALLDKYNIVLLDQRGTGYSAFAENIEQDISGALHAFYGHQRFGSGYRVA